MSVFLFVNVQVVIGKCVAGARIVSICEAGDKYITDACSKVYNKGKVEKGITIYVSIAFFVFFTFFIGIAFPTCISVNNVAGHFSPLGDDTTVLNTGDLVKMYIFFMHFCFLYLFLLYCSPV